MVDEAPIQIVAGLGNPGRRYLRTWHNLGFLVLDFWAMQKSLNFKPGRGEYAHLEFHSHRGVITFIKPASFMNLSGIPVAEIMRYRKVSPENTLIVCDDVTLSLGTIRIRKFGSDGGHKGLASIIAALGTEMIPRMRLGIYTEGWQGELSDYVLSRIPRALQDDVRQVVAAGAEALDCLLTEGLDVAMNSYNGNIFADGTDNIQGESGK